jgi:hypothetical protein
MGEEFITLKAYIKSPAESGLEARLVRDPCRFPYNAFSSRCGSICAP